MAKRPGRRRAKRCDHTFDLLGWIESQPPARAALQVERFDEGRVKAATLRAKIAHAVSETLRDCGKSREDVAHDMSVVLDEIVSKPMLDAYASEARADHTIPFLRLIALMMVTGDVRPLQLAAEATGHLVISAQGRAWAELGVAAYKRDHHKAGTRKADADYRQALRTVHKLFAGGRAA